jgi:hypothetical protein
VQSRISDTRFEATDGTGFIEDNHNVYLSKNSISIMDKTNGQLYKIRCGIRNTRGFENVIHAPAEASGWYSLTVNEDGCFKYTPVRVMGIR